MPLSRSFCEMGYRPSVAYKPNLHLREQLSFLLHPHLHAPFMYVEQWIHPQVGLFGRCFCNAGGVLVLGNDE